MDWLTVEVIREQEQMEWERAEMEAEALREARADEERAIRAAGGTVEAEPNLFDPDVPFTPAFDNEDVPF